jgi:hypothetical protein
MTFFAAFARAVIPALRNQFIQCLCGIMPRGWIEVLRIAQHITGVAPDLRRWEDILATGSKSRAEVTIVGKYVGLC